MRVIVGITGASGAANIRHDAAPRWAGMDGSGEE